MDYSQISAWFKDSIWGVIILGAIGSIVATCLIKIFKKLYGLYRYSKDQFALREYKQGLTGGLALGYIHTSNDTTFALSYYIYQVTRLIISCTSLILIASVLSYLLSNESEQVLTILSLFLSILLFMNLRWTYEEYRNALIPYEKYARPILRKFMDKYNNDKNNSTNKEDNKKNS